RVEESCWHRRLAAVSWLAAKGCRGACEAYAQREHPAAAPGEQLDAFGAQHHDAQAEQAQEQPPRIERALRAERRHGRIYLHSHGLFAGQGIEAHDALAADEGIADDA